MDSWVTYWALGQDLAVFIGIIVSTCTLISIARSLRQVVNILRRDKNSQE